MSAGTGLGSVATDPLGNSCGWGMWGDVVSQAGASACVPPSAWLPSSPPSPCGVVGHSARAMSHRPVAPGPMGACTWWAGGSGGYSQCAEQSWRQATVRECVYCQAPISPVCGACDPGRLSRPQILSQGPLGPTTQGHFRGPEGAQHPPGYHPPNPGPGPHPGDRAGRKEGA